MTARDGDFDPMVPSPDPYTPLRELAAQGPVHNLNGLQLVVTYGAVSDALLDVKTFSSCPARAPRGDEPEHLVRMDGDDHRVKRRLLSHAFTPRALASAEARVQAVADGLIETFASLNRVELISTFCAPLPSIVFSQLLGIPSEDQARFLRWSEDAIAHSNDPAGAPTDAEFRRYIVERVAERRTQPREDLLTELVHATDEERRLNDPELVATVRILIIAGNETTGNMLGTLFMNLLRRPALWEAVRADPALVPAAVEEAIRIDPPLLWVPRTSEDKAPAGLCLGSANHDAAVFENPDEFRLDRPSRGARSHLSFGFGEHFCLGAHLARLEGRVALQTMLDRLPDLRLSDGFEYAPRGPVMFRGVRDLPVDFGAGRPATPAATASA